MPFVKFRPQRQWGRFNTRIFKEILKARNKRRIGPPQISTELERAGIPVYDPLKPEFSKLFSTDDVSSLTSPIPKLHNKVTDEDHPLYKTTTAWLFEGAIGMTDGIDGACALIKAAPAQSIPNFIFENIPDGFLPQNFEEQIVDSILAGEKYDQTLEKLPKKFDPFLFWIQQHVHWGTPVSKKNYIILTNICRKVAYLSYCNEKNVLGDMRFDRDTPISVYFDENRSGLDAPLVFRQMPHLVMQTEFGPGPIATKNDVELSRNLNVPDLYPISITIDLEKTNVYNDSTLLPRQRVPSLHLNTIFMTRDTSTLSNQKYPWTFEQNAANAIANCFCAAVAQASRRESDLEFSFSNERDLEKPVTVKGAQLINGKLDLVLVQLNTLNLNSSKDAKDIKNLVWIDKALPLYQARPHYETLKEVNDLNMETVKKFVSLLLYS